MSYNRPIVLSIAGFDPCGGAGVLADIKTMEQHQCLGMAVNTSITNQVEDKFISVNWFSADDIIKHINTLTDKYKIDFVKIGIIENLNTLHAIVSFLKQQNNAVKIVWDTVLSASSGFNLIEAIDKHKLEDVLKNIFLITPNTNEAKKLFIAGQCDKMLPEEFLKRDAVNGGFNFISIKNASHFVTFDQPELVARSIEDFMRQSN